jgi:hypothetical protein
MKIGINELTGPALDWAVAKCVWTDRQIIASSGCRISIPVAPDTDPNDSTLRFFYEPSTNWAQGGPIIDREGVNTFRYNTLDRGAPWVWCGHKVVVRDDDSGNPINVALTLDGPTPLIAAMRCFVASKLGDEVDIPDEIRTI